MKVYRGYDKKVGPISYAHWTYVTPDIEQAKWYATKDGDIEDGGIIEYDLDVDNLRFISLDKLNSFAQDESEIYSEEDLLWYQEGLGESLYKYIAGVVFEDPHFKGHTIYIVFSKEHLKNGRDLSKEEFEKIPLKENINAGIDFVAYHGSHESDMIPMEGKALYLTDDFDLAVKFAKGQVYGDGLYKGEVATVYKYKGHFDNPYYMTMEEYDDEGQDDILDYEKWVKMGVDGIVLKGDDITTYYIVIDLTKIKMIDKKIFYDDILIEDGIESNKEEEPDIGEMRTYYRDYYMFEIEHIEDDEEMGGEEYYHIYVYLKPEGSNEYYEQTDAVKYSWIDCQGFMNDKSIEYKEKINTYKEPEESGEELNETREDLTNFNRIAGFYHLKTKKFELFPRTSEDISPEDDEINDYIHNVHSKDEFTEFDIVRFGIEDIPGEGVVCYIEGDTKRNVEKCYYAILEKYAEECDIIKYELEYYVGNEHKYIFLDRYGEQIMESVRPVNKEFADTKLVTSAYELNEIIKNHKENRVVYDVDKKWFLIANATDSLHFELINDALRDGLYPFAPYNGSRWLDGRGGDGIGDDGRYFLDMQPEKFILFRTTSDRLNGEDYYYDRYKYCYVYKDYCVFDRNLDFKKTPLYKLLGEPIELEFIGDIDENKELNESARGSESFWKWFRGSKVVDKEGNPLVVYHGTNDDFNEFKQPKENDGIYFTPDKEYAKSEGNNVIEAYLCIKNPRIIKYDSTETIEEMKQNGYDGCYIEDMYYWIAFYPNQIKSIKNGGRWDGSSNNIYESMIHAKSEGDRLTDIILKNPTRKELEDNHIERARCMVDGEGNWYFSDMFDTLHFQIEKLLRQNVSFPYYDGHDSYGISYYDVEGNEFWYNPNEIMPREKCVAQYYESPYLRKNFPDAYIRDNPYGFNSEDYENDEIQLNETVIKRDDGEIEGHYTQSTNEMLSIIDNKYPENDIRVLYDIERKLYIFADTYSAIHFNLILYMILFTNIYDDIPEIRDNKYSSDEILQDIVKSKLYLASFKIFRNYTNDSDKEFIRFLKNTPENATDSYDTGYACKINDKLWAICRNDEIGEAKQVPLLQNKQWISLA